MAQIEAGRERWQALNALADYDIPGNLERLQCPVLLLWGEHLYLQFREECTRRIKQHQALVIPHGRFCLPWEHPEAVGQATLAFVT